MTQDIIPQNLASLHSAEEQLRLKARSMIADDPRLQLHLAVTRLALLQVVQVFLIKNKTIKVGYLWRITEFLELDLCHLQPAIGTNPC